MTTNSNFLGTGWSFPPRPDGRGGIALVSDAEKIEQSIRIILSTPIGQRVMRPTFGSRLHELVLPRTPVGVASVQGNAVRAGALQSALATAREDVFGVVTPTLLSTRRRSDWPNCTSRKR